MDCKITENFLSEWYRLCKSKAVGYEACATCEMWFLDKEQGGCKASVMKDPQRAIKIVQRWSDEHPKKTLLTEFLKSYPNVKLNNCGYPEYIIPCELGVIHKSCAYQYNSSCDICQDCWNTPVEESEETK